VNVLRLAARSLFAIASIARADTLPSPAMIEVGLVGNWTGALGYRDYQTNQLFELVMKTEIRGVPDGLTFIRTSSFDDGPKVGLVWITSASLYDAAKNAVTTTTLRKGRTVETETDVVSVLTYSDATHWSVRYERDGTDDDKPAKLRTTETRDGDTVLAVKEVMPADAVAKGWQFRNQTRLVKDARP
jgi:hypothetical protein